MLRITLLNPKGGCGKTTLATNLASHYSRAGLPSALLDFDAQGSSTTWLETRPSELPSIHGVPAFRDVAGMTRAWGQRAPAGTERVIVDTPASVVDPRLDDLIRRSDRILVPVMPSPIDMDAFMKFAVRLAKYPRIRSGDAKVAVVANRVRRSAKFFRVLQAALEDHALDAPMQFIGSMRESQLYVKAITEGRGFQELRSAKVTTLYEDWAPLLGWIEDPNAPLATYTPDPATSEASATASSSVDPIQGRLNLGAPARRSVA